MGMDIHIDIVYKGEIIAEDIFEGRNSVWFNKLMGRTYAPEYDHLDRGWGAYPNAPKEYIDRYSDEGTYFGHGYIKVRDFIDWFDKYRPDLDAGWVSTYDKWRIEKKGYIPEEIWHTLDPKDNPADMHFIEIPNTWEDSSIVVYKYVTQHKEIPGDAYIIYCFDC